VRPADVVVNLSMAMAAVNRPLHDWGLDRRIEAHGVMGLVAVDATIQAPELASTQSLFQGMETGQDCNTTSGNYSCYVLRWFAAGNIDNALESAGVVINGFPCRFHRVLDEQWRQCRGIAIESLSHCVDAALGQRCSPQALPLPTIPLQSAGSAAAPHFAVFAAMYAALRG